MVMQRQGIQVSPGELKKLADNLEKEGKETAKRFGFKLNPKKKWLINIVNKTKASDMWKFEKSGKNELL